MDRANLESEIVRTIGAAITLELKNTRPSLATTDDLKLTENKLRTEIAELAQRVKNGFAALRLELERQKAELAHWMLAAFLTMFGLAIGAMYFMLQHFVQVLR